MHGIIAFARRAFQPIIGSRLLLCQLLNLPKNFFMMKDAKMSVVYCAKILARNSKWFRSYWGFSRGNDLCFTHCMHMTSTRNDIAGLNYIRQKVKITCDLASICWRVTGIILIKSKSLINDITMKKSEKVMKAFSEYWLW